MRQLGTAYGALAVIALAGCQMPNIARPEAPTVSEMNSRTRAIDWSRAETIPLTLSNYHFTPERLEFQQGRAYRLHLVNNSNSTHTFTSERFFHWELGSGWSWDANSRIRYRDRARRAEGSVFRRDRTGTV